jgi:Tfp pilus assembly protein PilX
MTKQFSSPHAERGAILVVGLIMLMLITVMVTLAFKFSTSNLKSVGNMQSRNEAIASANKAVEQVVESWDFATPPSADQISVDIDNDGKVDYVVNIATPICVKATPTASAADAPSDCTTDLSGATVCPSTATVPVFNVLWDIDATATSSSGARVRVRQGVSKSISQTQCDAACPPAAGAPCA